MKVLTHSDFELAVCQATVYTPDFDLSASLFMRGLYKDWAEIFDGEPNILPPLPGLPRDVPRISLKSESSEWACELASARINLFWRKTAPETKVPALTSFFRKAAELLLAYKSFAGARIGRLSAVVNRVAMHERPSLFLARHFCKSRWDAAPLNRPETFELHAHKVFQLTEEFSVNSWARNKTGTMTLGDSTTPVVVFEQDLNTLNSEMKTRSFSDGDISRFYEVIAKELDVVLSLYYPMEGAVN